MVYEENYLKVNNDVSCATVQCVHYSAYCIHIAPRSKEVSFNTQGIFSCVRYYRKEIFVKGRGPVGLRISKDKY